MPELLQNWRSLALDLLEQASAESDPAKRSVLEARAMVYIACRAEVQAHLHAEKMVCAAS